jgi:chemotaxis protein CheX
VFRDKEGSVDMDIRFINPFIASVKKVFKTMVATDITVGKPVVNPAHQEPIADVSAVIGLSGDVVGCTILSLPMQTAINASSKFAGIEMDRNHQDFSDALGELANMVVGQAKSQLEGFNVSISLPSVIVGEEHVVSQSKQRPRLSIPCQSELGPFFVEIAIVVEKKQQAEAPAASAAAG